VTSPIELKRRQIQLTSEAGFFAEEVRRKLVKQFGEKSLYEEGLSVHTTLSPKLQEIAEKSLRNGLVSYDRRHGYRGSLGNMDISNHWASRLTAFKPPAGIGNWKTAVVLDIKNFRQRVIIGFDDGTTNHITFKALEWALKRDLAGQNKDNNSFRQSPQYMNPQDMSPQDILRAGDIILVKEINDDTYGPYALRQIPEVNGALVALDPHTGKVLAMSGGFTFDSSKFNRATQARRQPGSAFKPFVYLAALENGYTPADLIADEPIEFKISGTHNKNNGGKIVWAPQNYTGNFYGPTTLRMGVEKSINVMTIHLSMLLGIDKITDIAKRFAINSSPPRNMSTPLGSAETNLLSLTTAYGMLVNGGKFIEPMMIDRIHDRNGKIIWRGDKRECVACAAPTDSANPGSQHSTTPPEIMDTRRQVTDAHSAFQIVSILQGVVEHGTAAYARDIGKIVGGKTGTTNNNKDAWFIGFTPDLVVGVYVGFDTPKSLGNKEQGASVALPIFTRFMKSALKGKPSIPFRIPEGIKLVKIDKKTGFPPSEETPDRDIILEAFKPNTEPSRIIRRSAELPVINPSKLLGGRKVINTPATRGTGGIY